MRGRKRKIEGRKLSKGKKVVMLTGVRKDRAKVGDLQEAESEEHGMAIDGFIRFPELRTKS